MTVISDKIIIASTLSGHIVALSISRTLFNVSISRTVLKLAIIIRGAKVRKLASTGSNEGSTLPMAVTVLSIADPLRTIQLCFRTINISMKQ
jgi:hypothetical protein